MTRLFVGIMSDTTHIIPRINVDFSSTFIGDGFPSICKNEIAKGQEEFN